MQYVKCTCVICILCIECNNIYLQGGIVSTDSENLSLIEAVIPDIYGINTKSLNTILNKSDPDMTEDNEISVEVFSLSLSPSFS